MEKQDAKTIATETLQQLGGKKFMMMTGAKNIVCGDNGFLAFRLPRYAGLKINYVKVSLNEMDVYDVEFGQIRGMNYKQIKIVNGVYNDQLQTVFTAETGLDTSL